MSSHKKKDKRKQKKAKEKARRARIGRMQRDGLGDAMLIVDAPGQAKMSEVLLEFLEPYSEHGQNEEQLKKLVVVGIVAWNAAIVSGGKRDELIQSTLRAMPPEIQEDYLAILGDLIKRKEAHFAGNRRMILDYQLTPKPDGAHLSVISTLDVP